MSFFSQLSSSYFKSRKRITSVVLALVAISLYTFTSISNRSFVFDEAYTMAMIQHSYSNIWNITAMDVHPPLYYFMLKFFSSVFGNSLFTLRLFSLLGVLAILLVGIFPIKKEFGVGVSFLFVLIVILLPVTQYLADEIRMYSWCMFFTLTNSILAYRVFFNSNKLNNTLLTILALAGAYTHYYCMIGALTIYGILLLAMILNKKNITLTIISLVIFLIGFSFWIPELIYQITAVKQNYWIGAPSLKDLLLLCYYPFSPKEPADPYTIFTLPTMASILSIMLLLIGWIGYIAIKKYKKLDPRQVQIGILFILVFLIPIAMTIIFSYLLKPIIIPRYTTCFLGCLVLGIAIILKELYIEGSKKSRCLIFASLFVLAILALTRFFAEREQTIKSNKQFDEIRTYFADKNTNKAAFMSSFQACGWLGMISVMYPSLDNIYFVYSYYKTPASFGPFKLIEVNKLPQNFDFHYTQTYDENPIQTKSNNYFINGIKPNYIIVDSLNQRLHTTRIEGRVIYQMRTIHRERETQQKID